MTIILVLKLMDCSYYWYVLLEHLPLFVYVKNNTLRFESMDELSLSSQNYNMTNVKMSNLA